MAAITRTVRVAAGVFAPGHLGELTSIVPFELVDAVLAETGTVQARLRNLPSRVGVYFVLAMCLFPEVGYRRVWAKMIAGLVGLVVVVPSGKGLRDLRRRVGPAPVKALFEVLAGPLAQPHTPGVRFGRYRTVSFDGCTSQRTADTARNRAWLGKRTGNGYPAVELMTLVETGTRGMLGAVFGPTAEGETSYASKLLHLLDAGMLVLWDKGFDSNMFLTAVAGTGAQFLGRLRGNRRLPVLARLDDGSYLSVLNHVPVRVIDATVTVTCADATTYTGVYRLVTSLRDPRRHPAHRLVELYHQRWEHESAYYALRHTILHGRILRSGDPTGIQQELWALLTVYQALRTAMVHATETRPGTDPDRASFTIALHTAREQLTNAADVLPENTDLTGAIGRAVLAELLPPRRARTSTRRVKSPLSRYAKHPPGRPTTNQKITNLAITIHDDTTEPLPPPTPSPPRKPRKPRLTAAATP
ncbi:DDE family transposase [Micromonospora olivasterospora]|uniref:DDE family transposase n=1 Tax=Micromonospora olivasterospora TaxID=1880 RepID=A0A562II74_MICOL|nr:DDE family transposase [Micromonospora olivasterospora]